MTRFWFGVSPSLLCRQHLLGEHAEIHQFLGSLRAGHYASVAGHLRKGNVTIQPMALKRRHEALAAEMEYRGYNHNSPLPGDYHGLMREAYKQLREVEMLTWAEVVRRNEQEIKDRCPLYGGHDPRPADAPGVTV